MADKFGAQRLGRVYEGGKFYAVPAVDVPANTIYCPRGGTAPDKSIFGVAEYPVASGDLGAFSTVGTFAFPKPSDWTSTVGRAVYYKPTDTINGTITSGSSSAVPIGREVRTPETPDDQIWVCIG